MQTCLLTQSSMPLWVSTESCQAELQIFLRTHRAPPQGIGVGSKLLVELVLHKVDEERREDENQEADVPGGYQFLQAEVKTDFQSVIMEKRQFC